MSQTKTPSQKTPAELIAEMEGMARLHSDWFWSHTMKDGADMIRKLCALANKLKQGGSNAGS